MEVVHVVSCIIFLLTVTASPEIPSKGKHIHMGDKSQTSLEDADMPRFAEPVANVTVSVGRDALLACVVENLKGYKVAWVRVDTQTILSIHHNVISQNNRISLTYNDHRSWYLHIKEVEESDRGWYMCQVNTDPMRSRKGYLQVVVPPMIVEGMTSNDLVVREGLNVTLMCKARGYPEPYVMWRREDGEEMLIGGEHVNVVDGELLHITKVSRLHMAAYLCVASNGVPPSISKRVHLRVQFPPMLSIPNQLEGAYVGQDVVLECHTEAYPASINYWTTERGDMIISDTSRAGDKYETTSTVNGYTKYMKLKIRNVGPNDFGTYRCVAKNSLGETDGNIKLDEMPAPTTAILSEMAMLNRSLDGKRRNKTKLDSNSLPDYGVEEWRDGAGHAGDNNQAPMRNPPDAFHNSAGALAQHNPVGVIIQAIKMQSLGIFKRLTNLMQTINECDTTAWPASDAKKTTATVQKATITTTTETALRKIIQKYVHKIQKLTVKLATTLVKAIKSTDFTLRQQGGHKQQQQQQQQRTKQQQHHIRKNLITENEFKTCKHYSSTRMPVAHISRQQTYARKQRQRKSKKRANFSSLNAKTLTTLKTPPSEANSNVMAAAHVAHFHEHVKQQEILHKFNTIHLTNNNKNHKNIGFSYNLFRRHINSVANAVLCWCRTKLFVSLLLLVVFMKIFPTQSFQKPLKFLTNSYKHLLSQQLLVFLLQQQQQKLAIVVVRIILWHNLWGMSVTLKNLKSLHSKLNFFAKSMPSIQRTSTVSTSSLPVTASSFTVSPAQTTTSTASAAAAAASSTASSPTSAATSNCSTLLFGR